jgi:N-acetylglutamate synthase-like GNAT family acetyltransferase|tara:strand:- start:20771 stop:21202 length:432 start_codon:yes stop_codon:yes gene_type:complete
VKGVILRKAQVKDKKGIRTLLKSSKLQTWYLDDNLDNFVVAYQREFVGCGCLCLHDGVFELRGLCVRSSFRGKGFGSKLFKFLMKKAVGKKVSQVFVRLENKKLVSFYEQFGFKTIAKSQCPIKTKMPGINVLPMKLFLKNKQ